jgi:hypothetical protein
MMPYYFSKNIFYFYIRGECIHIYFIKNKFFLKNILVFFSYHITFIFIKMCVHHHVMLSLSLSLSLMSSLQMMAIYYQLILPYLNHHHRLHQFPYHFHRSIVYNTLPHFVYEIVLYYLYQQN